MNMPVVPKVKMKVPEFLAWAEAQPRGRFELVNGEVVAMSPERARHNLVMFEAALTLREAIRAAQLPCTVFTDGMTIVIDEHTSREPDAAVQCGIDVDLDSTILKEPLVVLEVVSPSTERDDTGVKLVDYFSVASIEHYLIVHAGRSVVVHHQRTGQGTLHTRIAHPGEDIALNPPGISVRVAALLGTSIGSGAGDDR
jgi:Uma2 family endonuclease